MIGPEEPGAKPAGSDANRDITPDEAAEEAFPAPAEPTAPDPHAGRRDADLPPTNPREEAEPPQEGSLGT